MARFGDPRFDHLWDDGVQVGHWYKDHVVPRLGELRHNREFNTGYVWDAFFLYAKSVKWAAAPPHPLAAGAPIIEQFPVPESALRVIGK